MQYAHYFEKISNALELIDESVIRHKDVRLQQLARALEMSEDTLQRSFSALVGISPKRYWQVRLMQLCEGLNEYTNNLDLSLDLGLSSPSRLNDLFVNVVAMTPREYASDGGGLVIRHGCGSTPFGEVALLWSDRGIIGLEFNDDIDNAMLLYWQAQWPAAEWVDDNGQAQHLLERIFGTSDNRQPLSVWLKGTNFQINVWRALLSIPSGQSVTYSDIAADIDNKSAVRAVGSAIGANPVAYVIPCHRVIRANGGLGGYRWGIHRKRILLAAEEVRSLAMNGQ